jgi:chromosome segregation ATPase
LKEDDEIKAFEKAMKYLRSDDSPLSVVDEKTKQGKSKYKQWCDIVKSEMNDVMEYQRLKNEKADLENRIKSLEPSLVEAKDELQKSTRDLESTRGEISDLREMYDSAKRWVEAAQKIAVLRLQVLQKEEDFRMMNSDKEGRTLEQVMNNLRDLEKKKDEYSERQSALNKEMSDINERVSSLSSKATKLEDDVRRMQEKYDEDLKLEERKTELTKKYAELKNEQDKVGENNCSISRP